FFSVQEKTESLFELEVIGSSRLEGDEDEERGCEAHGENSKFVATILSEPRTERSGVSGQPCEVEDVVRSRWHLHPGRLLRCAPCAALISHSIPFLTPFAEHVGHQVVHGRVLVSQDQRRLGTPVIFEPCLPEL